MFHYHCESTTTPHGTYSTAGPSFTCPAYIILCKRTHWHTHKWIQIHFLSHSLSLSLTHRDRKMHTLTHTQTHKHTHTVVWAYVHIWNHQSTTLVFSLLTNATPHSDLASYWLSNLVVSVTESESQISSLLNTNYFWSTPMFYFNP